MLNDNDFIQLSGNGLTYWVTLEAFRRYLNDTPPKQDEKPPKQELTRGQKAAITRAKNKAAKNETK